LLWSGVGPADELARHGIPQMLELPGVGKNLQDHPDVLIVHKATRRVGYSLGPLFLWRGAKVLVDYLARGRGPFTSNIAEAGGFARIERGLDAPDQQSYFLPVIQENHGLVLRRSLGFGGSLHVCVLRPRSRGEIGLKSADQLADPRIQPNYLADPSDLRALVAGVRAARRILAAPAFDSYRGLELFPGEQARSDAAIKAFVRQRCETLYHPVGTCKMGIDAMAAVAPDLRVRGLDGIARGRCVDHVHAHRRQHQHADHHDRRKSRGHDSPDPLRCIDSRRPRANGGCGISGFRSSRLGDPGVGSLSVASTQGGVEMPRGDKSSYTSKQKRKAEHIEEGYEKKGVSKKEAEERAWRTVNKQDKGGKKKSGGSSKKHASAKKSGSGRKTSSGKKTARKSAGQKRTAVKKSGGSRKRSAAKKSGSSRKRSSSKK
jgi:hypothetical protein